MIAEIEFFRILSVFGIVWFHSCIDIGRNIAYGGLIFFIIIAAYFATVSKREHRLLERVERLIVPFFVWGAFYGIISFVTKGNFYPENFTLIAKILVSPSLHLWFLPFIFVALVTIDNFHDFLSMEMVAIVIGLIVICLISLSPIWQPIHYALPFGQYIHALPAVLIGIFFGIMKNIRRYVRIFLIVCVFCSIIVMISMRLPSVGVAYLIGILPCLFLFKGHCIDGRTLLIKKFSSSSFGIYLSHSLTLTLVRLSGLNGVLLPLCAFILSFFIVILCKSFVPEKYVKYIM